jgi:hypothetical protein
VDEIDAESWSNFCLSCREAKYHFAGWSDDTMLKKTIEEFGFAIVPEVIEAENLQVTRR